MAAPIGGAAFAVNIIFTPIDGVLTEITKKRLGSLMAHP
jgi:hypothetical protein